MTLIRVGFNVNIHSLERICNHFYRDFQFHLSKNFGGISGSKSINFRLNFGSKNVDFGGCRFTPTVILFVIHRFEP